MTTRAQLEERVDELEDFVADVDETLLDLHIDLRSAHDMGHSDAWAVCTAMACKVARELEALRAEAQEIAP